MNRKGCGSRRPGPAQQAGGHLRCDPPECRPPSTARATRGQRAGRRMKNKAEGFQVERGFRGPERLSPSELRASQDAA